MNPVLFNPIDYDTILNLCTVFLCLQSHFVKINSHLRGVTDRLIDIQCHEKIMPYE